jgi:hypothetical protein
MGIWQHIKHRYEAHGRELSAGTQPTPPSREELAQQDLARLTERQAQRQEREEARAQEFDQWKTARAPSPQAPAREQATVADRTVADPARSLTTLADALRDHDAHLRRPTQGRERSEPAREEGRER